MITGIWVIGGIIFMIVLVFAPGAPVSPEETQRTVRGNPGGSHCDKITHEKIRGEFLYRIPAGCYVTVETDESKCLDLSTDREVWREMCQGRPISLPSTATLWVRPPAGEQEAVAFFTQTARSAPR